MHPKAERTGPGADLTGHSSLLAAALLQTSARNQWIAEVPQLNLFSPICCNAEYS